MFNKKRVIALSLASAMAATAVGCSSSSSKSTETTKANDSTTTAAGDTTAASGDTTAATGDTTAATGDTTAATGDTTAEANDTTAEAADTSAASGEHRDIRLGTWWDMYYTSEHTDINDQPGVTDEEIAQMQLDCIRNIEAKYNVSFYADNMTWDGIISSINTSIMSGKPDEDVYLTDLQFGVPAVLANLAIGASEYGATADLEEATVVKGLKVGSGEDTYLFKQQEISSNDVFVLGFNMDMIKAKGLENPQDIYDRGEWTWEKFLEYCQALTEDTDGDGATDVYGYGGWWTIFLKYLLLSNSADIAATSTEHLSDPKTVEVIEFIYDLYNTYKVARPWNSEDWNDNVFAYTRGEMAFWVTANWVASECGDADTDKVSFEVGFVPFPKGPSAEETVATKSTAGNWYMIPKGTSDPTTVYHVMYDWINWYNNDVEYRDNNEWASKVTYSPKADDPERNFNILLQAAQSEAYDPWDSLKVDGNGAVGLGEIMTGEKTAAQYIEENKQIVQNCLDEMF